jgi:hypothetical protein
MSCTLENMSDLQDKFNTGDNEFDNAANAWLQAVQTTVMDTQVNKDRHPDLPAYVLKLSPKGQNYIRVVMENGPGHRSSWAFVATKDGKTAAMGQFKKGDIFKSGGWSAPAKHARGNIFDLSNGPTCNVKAWTGPEYLR